MTPLARKLILLLLLPGLQGAALAAEPPEDAAGAPPGTGEETSGAGEETAGDSPAEAGAPGDEEQQSETSQAGNEELVQEGEQEEPGDDRFIPSTQISEDLSVSFPVDI